MDNVTQPQTVSDQKNCGTCCGHKCGHNSGVLGSAYGLAFLGAAVYYLQHATTFWAGVLGILKAMVWPALVVYKLLEFLKM